MKTLFVPLMGRFGNQMFIYAHARAVAEREGLELCVGPWVGEKIFDIPKSRRCQTPDVRLNQGYYQDQGSVNYTREQLKSWFVLNERFRRIAGSLNDGILAHKRVGDYPGTGFPVVSEQSYLNAAAKFGYDPAKIEFITEEKPTRWTSVSEADLAFVPDFLRLMHCPVLFRGNSTFSWWAATLGNGKVYAPVVDGRVGGREQDCEFVEGNYPKWCNSDCVTDIRL